LGVLRKRGKAYYLDYRDASGKRVVRRGSPDKTKAKQLLEAAEAKKAAVRLGIADAECQIADAELEKVRAAYLDHLRLHRRPRTVERAKDALETVLGHVGAVRASHLTVEGIERFQRHREQSVSRRTVNLETGALKAMLNWAVDARLVRENPLARLKPLKQDTKRFRRALKPAEGKALLEAARKHYPGYADIFLCALHTGLRRGELVALEWADVDFDAREITVQGTVAKNHRERRVPMSGELTARLRALRASQRDCEPPRPLAGLVERLATRERNKDRTPDRGALEAEARKLRETGAARVFKTEYGTPIGNNLLLHLRLAVKRAGIDPRGVDLHALRYSFGSWLVVEGVNIKLVSRLMGHATVQITLDIYTDTSIMDWHGAVAKLPALEAESGANGDRLVTSPQERAQRKVG